MNTYSRDIFALRYAKGGRGYPDVALAGYGYEVIIGGAMYSVSGTSCSSPAVAAMGEPVPASGPPATAAGRLALRSLLRSSTFWQMNSKISSSREQYAVPFAISSLIEPKPNPSESPRCTAHLPAPHNLIQPIHSCMCNLKFYNHF